ncbi:histidine--tRNA ligase [Metallumcola ferriviriculae]|uniref:Histidine--tRNA ligase n=1 Tax=Metallumcola ferriviriculae TaxID=3039180 RepID=A0AAU0USI1_9FIRM|nr:histidine--tRNA ligase [Desulfitibacteraceae bacterium MK1]
MLTTRPRGTNDQLPLQTLLWRKVEAVIHQICADYGYQEIRTPIFEHTELFKRGVGETTDIVEKEMYTFTDRGDRSLTLRPEGTAPAVRAFLENKMYADAQPTKLYYLGPMFRYGRPQAGRFRQFHQFGIEVFGSKDPVVDAEVITLAMDFYRRLGLKGLELHINSVGCPKCRMEHKQALHEFLEPKKDSLCETCQGRRERNPLRIFDCKSPVCQELIFGAPTVTSMLCPECAEHFEQVQQYLQLVGVPFAVDETMVRGIDYYTNTAFEIVVDGIGAQSSIAGGGRYDGLMEDCGGPSTPGIGFGQGLERILATMEQQGLVTTDDSKLDLFIVTMDDKAKQRSFVLLEQLRNNHVRSDHDVMKRSVKAQMKQADRMGANYCLIIGEVELKENKAVLKDMTSGEQEEIALEDVVEIVTAKAAGRKNNG